jgi:hypothetical protein
MDLCIQCPYCLEQILVIVDVRLGGLFVDTTCCECGKVIQGVVKVNV